MVMRSEGWLEGGDRKLRTRKAKAEVRVDWKMLLTVIREFEDPTQEMPVLMF